MNKYFVVPVILFALICWKIYLSNINNNQKIGDYIIAIANEEENSLYKQNIDKNENIKQAINDSDLTLLNDLYNDFSIEDIQITNLKFLNLFQDLKNNTITITNKANVETPQDDKEILDDPKLDNNEQLYTVINLFRNNTDFYGKMIQTNIEMEDQIKTISTTDGSNIPYYLIEYDGFFKFYEPISIDNLSSPITMADTGESLYNLQQVKYIINSENKKYLVYDISKSVFVDIFELQK